MSGKSLSVVLVKLGGSLITDKRGLEAYRPRVVARLASEIARASAGAGGALILGHGAGSFGHAAAVRHGIGSGPLASGAARGIAEVQDRAAALHRRVMSDLARAGLAPFSVSPSSVLVARAGRVGRFPIAPAVETIRAGLVPVVYGDVVVDRAWGASICSTETAFVALARALRRAGVRVERALFVGATPGVLDERGRTIETISTGRARAALRAAGGSHGPDVTGGMHHRVRSALALARLGVPCWIGDGRVVGRLATELAGGRAPGTRVVPSR